MGREGEASASAADPDNPLRPAPDLSVFETVRIFPRF
jgi:hypothetical protein